ncbi:MAG TPA: hypothetical protein VLV30_07290 [Methanomicrobiales archaeon]|nr:hypothetical protein [Methanomicrobiales archaeon]
MDRPESVAGHPSAPCTPALVQGTASEAVAMAGEGAPEPGPEPVHHHLSPREILAPPEEKGVNISPGKTTLQRGDSAGARARAGIDPRHQKMEIPDGSAHPSPVLTDPTQEQKAACGAAGEGVALAGAVADLRNGNAVAVKTWIETWLHAHEAELP